MPEGHFLERNRTETNDDNLLIGVEHKADSVSEALRLLLREVDRDWITATLCFFNESNESTKRHYLSYFSRKHARTAQVLKIHEFYKEETLR